MKTFRQIADENHLDRTTIFKRAKKIPNFKTKHLTKKNGKWFVNDSGVKLLVNYRGTRPKKYKSRINTKYDYWKRAKYLEDQNKWLQNKVSDLMATNSKQATKLADDKQMEQGIRTIANRSANHQKQLSEQKLANQPKLQQGQSYSHDLGVENNNLRNSNNDKDKKLKSVHDKLNRHGLLKWLYNHSS